MVDIHAVIESSSLGVHAVVVRWLQRPICHLLIQVHEFLGPVMLLCTLVLIAGVLERFHSNAFDHSLDG